MPEHNYGTKEQIRQALKGFNTPNLKTASITLLNELGYSSDKTIDIPNSDPTAFLELASEHNPNIEINKDKALFDNWLKADILFQLTDEEITKDTTKGPANTQLLQSYLFFAIELKQQDYARGKLIAIARQINRVFPMPVMVLIKHGELLSVAIINRRQNKKESEKDVLGKATIIRDISLLNPHTGHIQILSEFSMQNLKAINSFDSLHAAWEEILNIELLNKKFYNELSNWYFWAINKVSFPGEPTSQSFFEKTGSADQAKLQESIQEHNAKNVIRLLTRFLFVWFIKEKQLIPAEFFDVEYLQKEMLKDLSPYHKDGLFKSANIQSHYYKAILQNLFFATLNQEMGKRAFRRSGQNMNVTNLLRYENCFKNPEKFIELAEKYTPFMNGGLFECLDKPHPTKKGLKGGDVIVYEDGFSDRLDNPLKVPDYLFFGHDTDLDLSDQYGSKAKKYKQAAVRGLINIFNSYKFTIAENTPIDQEIALDPELLGKVFENLLASYNPETKTTARKQTGSFYTPREIVGYMVDESLIVYLKNEVEGWGLDEKELDAKLHELLSYDDSNPFLNNQSLQKKIINALDGCKILDPACGSGAFPMGILQKMVHILQKVDPENIYWQELQMENAVKETETVFHLDDNEKREQKLVEINEAFDQKINDPDYARKLFLIENCIYGVDIQPIATQISKLRFFISLVVDQKIDKNKANFGVRPLPNLETKFVAANTLIGIDKHDENMVFETPEVKEKEAELIEVRHRIFAAKTPHTKRKLRDKDKKIRDQMGKLLIADGWASKTANQLVGWDPYDQSISSVFFDPEWMFGVIRGFDVIIGNPPYIKEYTEKSAFDGLRESPYYQGKMDLWYLFACNGLDILNDRATLSFIATNNWVTNFGASKMRNKIISDTRILKLLDFNNFKIFDSAGIQTMIMMFQKDSISDNYEFDYRKLNNNADNLSDVEDLLAKNNNGKHEIFSPIINRKNLQDKPLTFTNPLISSVLDKINQLDYFNLSNSEVAQGIVPPQDFLNKKNNEKLDNIYNVGDGVFVISDNEYQELNFTFEEKKILKPYFTTNELHRYFGNNNNCYWIIYTSSEFKNPEKMLPYPNIKNHLDRFMDIITSHNKPYGLHRSRDESFFNNEKIISLRKCSNRPVFTYTDFDCYVSSTFFLIKTSKINLIALTGFLNSSLCAFFLKYKGKMQGNNYQIDKEPLVNIPIPNSLGSFEDAIIELVKKIIKIKSLNINDDTLQYEKEIDQLVYQLYNLTKEEIEIIENSIQ